MTHPQTSACCGAGVIMVDFSAVCEDCGRQFAEPELVSLPPLPSEKKTASSLNHVSARDNGTNLLVTSAVRRARAPRLSSTLNGLEAQAACKANELRLPDSVPRAISELLRSELWSATSCTARADPAVAVAVLLYVGARLSHFPMTLRGVCAACTVPPEQAMRLFALVCRGLAQALPSPSVRPPASLALAWPPRAWLSGTHKTRRLYCCRLREAGSLLVSGRATDHGIHCSCGVFPVV